MSAEAPELTIIVPVYNERERVREALDEARPATHDDIRELQKELRAISRRLETIEQRLPVPKPSTKAQSSGTTARKAARAKSSSPKKS